jgi:predicted MFS family arabinose efflux permease
MEALPRYWRLLPPLFLLTFFSWIDHLIMVPLSADISRDTGLDPLRSGLLVSVYPAAGAVSAFLFAPWSDRLGRKRMMLILSAGFVVATLGCALAPDVFTILLFRVLSGAFAGPIMSNCLAYAGDALQSPERERALTNIMLGFTLASILGVPVGAALAEWFSWRWAFGGIAFGGALAALWIATLPAIATGAESGSVKAQYVEMLALWRWPEVRLVFVMQFFMMIGLFGFIPQLSIWLTTNYGLTAATLGLCYMQGGVGSLLGNRLAGWLLQRGWRFRLIGLGSLLMGAAMVIATQELLPVAWVGGIFFGIMLGGSMRWPGLQTVLVELTGPQMRGRLMSMSLIVTNLTMGLGGVWSTALLDMQDGRLEGMAHIGLVAMGTLAVVPLLAWLVRQRLQAPQPAAAA